MIFMKATVNNKHSFTISHTWDGKALAVEEHARVLTHWLTNGDLAIEIDAPFADDPQPVSQTSACWGLWNYEVVELFVVGEGDPVPYTEIEVSPWGHHLVLQLLGVRNIVAQELPLKINLIERNQKRWRAQAVIKAELLPKGSLKVNAYRVSGVEPERHYHVMTPMIGPVADFHHIDQFTQTLIR